MLVVDSHLDIAMNAQVYNRDLTRSISEIRAAEANDDREGLGNNTVSYPELRRSEVAISFCTVLARCASGRTGAIDYRTQASAYAHTQGELGYYREMDRQGEIRLLTTRSHLDDHLSNWERDPGKTPLGMILTMEGADPITGPEALDAWWNDGLRALSLAHYGPSLYAHGTQSLGGLTQKGRELLARMNKMGFVLDVSHFNEESFWEGTGLFTGPLWASHSNCQALVPGDRQLSDDMLKVVIDRDGVIGSVLDAWMLQPGWVQGETHGATVTMNDFVDHIDHVCQIAGNANHAAIGTDLDGGYGTEQTPSDCDTIYALQSVPDLLTSRGYSPNDIEQIMHGNWIRMLRRVLPA